VYRVSFILAAVVLVGCATHSPETEAQAQADAVAKDAAKCQSYGLQPGNPEYEKCLTQLADKRAQADTNNRSALAGRLQSQPPPWAR
jgi:outer membrane PBP1 activator LpoA protein